MDKRVFVEAWELKNSTDSIVELFIGNIEIKKVAFGNYGQYTYGVKSNGKESVVIQQGETYQFEIHFYAQKGEEAYLEDTDHNIQRNLFLDEVHSKLILQTPNEELNTLFAFSKVRVAENIFDSKMGLVHSPGGGRYYAGVWANDQAEYSGPFFPYLGLEDGNIAALNVYKKLYEQMQTIPLHDKNLWSSFEVNGEIPCCGGDRGDAAMIAYGGLHYLLALGDPVVAET